MKYYYEDKEYNNNAELYYDLRYHDINEQQPLQFLYSKIHIVGLEYVMIACIENGYRNEEKKEEEEKANEVDQNEEEEEVEEKTKTKKNLRYNKNEEEEDEEEKPVVSKKKKRVQKKVK